MKEDALTFGGKNSLVGILTEPAQPGRLGAILLNAGVLHRVGPGRIYVRIARELALLGFTSLRFDFSGIGDSKPRQDHLPFDKSSIEETQSAMSLLEARGVDRFILMGGCSGARVSFATAASDARVTACILVNFQVTSDDELDRDSNSNQQKDAHYYLNFAVRNSHSWGKFLTGRADYSKLWGAVRSILRRHAAPRKSAAEPAEWPAFRDDLKRVVDRHIKPVFICSEGDPALDELREAGGHDLSELCSHHMAEIVVIPRSDHTFSSLADQERLLKVLEERFSDIARSGTLRQPDPGILMTPSELPAPSKTAHVQ